MKNILKEANIVDRQIKKKTILTNKPGLIINMPLPLLKQYHFQPTQLRMASETMPRDWKNISFFQNILQNAQLI